LHLILLIQKSMKHKFTQQSFTLAIKIVAVICSLGIIFYFMPRAKNFGYTFEVGRPWQYELLTASFDFPIYKSDKEIKKEEDSLLTKFVPYFNLNGDCAKEQLDKFSEETDNKLDARLHAFVAKRLKEIYAKGVVNFTQLEKLKEIGVKEISVITKNVVAGVCPIDDVFTTIEAYDYLFQDVSDMDTKTLRTFNMNRYIVENLIYDEKKSEQVKEELLSTVSRTYGLVQAGERIIDRGEIVTENDYKIINSLKIITEQQQHLSKQKTYLMVVGELLIIVIIVGLFLLYLYLFRPKFFYSTRSLLFFLAILVAMVAMASLAMRHTSLSPYILPFALLPIMVRVFFDSRTALFEHITAVLLSSFVMPNPYQFVLIQIIVGMVAVSTLKNMEQRSQLIQTAFWIFLTYSFTYLALMLMKSGTLENIDWWNFASFGVNGLLLLFAYGFIYIIEKTFDFLSDVTLIELSNINSKLMTEFSEKAPGTFQHSLQVSNLATEAAKKINANTLLVRTGALYHDIGKLTNPILFVENQVNYNPLMNLPFEKAAEVVINHVAEGVRLAEKHGLPRQIIDFIKTHHGKRKASYFYNSYKNQFPNQPINEAKFTYPGPLPNTKETAILMMADAVEASSRSLKEHTEEEIDNLVDSIIDAQIAEGSFKNAPITFKNIETVKGVFKAKLKNIYHSRISYPELKKTSNNEETNQA
jgi:putative nucleotidyltransferase with HDIG domain